MKKLIKLPQEQLNMFLQTAVEARNYEKAELIIKQGAMGQSKKGSPLHTAASKSDARMVSLLLQYGFDNAEEYEGKTPTELVAKEDLTTYSIFAQKKDLGGARYHHALLNAVKQNNFEIAEAFLKAGADPNAKFEEEGKQYFIIHVAAENKDIAMLQLLLRFKVDISVEQSDKSQSKPTQVLAQNRWYQGVKLLAESNAELENQYYYGRALVTLADSKLSLDPIDNKELISAAHSLLKAGAKINCCYKTTKNSSLHLAAANRNNALIALLLSFGAKSKPNKAGKKPIELVNKDDYASYHAFAHYGRDNGNSKYTVGSLYAVRKNDLALTKRFLEAGADISSSYNFKGGSYCLIHLAAAQGNLKMLKLLLSFGADLGAVGSDKENKFNPIKIMINKGHWECIKLVVSLKKEQRKNEFDYGLALLHAANQGFIDIAESLLKRGVCSAWRFNSNKNTSLHVAVINNHHRMIALLLNFTADVEKLNIDGKTPSDIANETKDLDLIECLVNPSATAYGVANDKIIIHNLNQALFQKESPFFLLFYELLELILSFAFNDISFVRKNHIGLLERISKEVYLNSVSTVCTQYQLHKAKEKIPEKSSLRFWKTKTNQLQLQIPIDDQLISNLQRTLNSGLASNDKIMQCIDYISDYWKIVVKVPDSNNPDRLYDAIEQPEPIKNNKIQYEDEASVASLLSGFTFLEREQRWVEKAITKYHLVPGVI